MKKTIILATFLPLAIYSQDFSEQTTVLKGHFFASASVADIDNDGKKDIFINGAIDSDGDSNPDTTYNQAYTVSNYNFSNSYTLADFGTHTGDIKVFDFNNDGLNDVITTGDNYLQGSGRHYRHINTGSGFNFVFDEEGKSFTSMDVFDLNHDGLLDYAVSGQDLDDEYNIVYYQNSNSGFLSATDLVTDASSGDFRLIDINNDKELDLVYLGLDSRDEGIFKVFLRNSGTFVESQSFTDMRSASLDVADFNADGFLDLVVVGRNSNNDDVLAYYMNNGTGSFTETQIPNEGLDNSFVHCGDFNNDGYPDFVILGDVNYNSRTEIFYYNPTQNTFTKGSNTGLTPLGGPGFINSIDIDDDKDLDLVINGINWNAGAVAVTKLYQNNRDEGNSPPTPPTTMNANISGSRVEFSWSGATDSKTPTAGLSYEITVGSNPGGFDIARYEVKTPFWYLNIGNMPSQIYWSVRAIDASRAMSSPSTVNSLMLSTTEVKNKETIKIYPNPTSGDILLNVKPEKVEVYSVSGQLVKMFLDKSNSYSIADLKPGAYIVKVKTIEKEFTQKIIKK